jgi:hypothetical protein
MQAPEIESAVIVMIGSFNPTIFQPRWLGARQLIRPEEADHAKITTIQSEVADFSTEWFEMQVLQNRFQVASTDPTHYAPLRDLSMGIFAILPHTPVKRLGLNRNFHFAIPSIDEWHEIGNLLAPKEPWNGIMEIPGLRSMLMQGRRKQAGGGTLHIKIEPSVKVNPGLYVEINEEFKEGEGYDAGGEQNPLEEVELDREEVSKSDLPLLAKGAVFYCSIGYRDTPGGQRERIFTLRFARQPRLSRAEVKRIFEEADRLAAFLESD